MQLYNVCTDDSWRSKFGVTEDGESVLEEGRAGERLGGDVGEVVRGRELFEVYSFALLGVMDHGVLGGRPISIRLKRAGSW